MKITGSLILDTLATLREEAQIVKNEYLSSLTYYKSDETEDRDHPETLMDKYIGYQIQIGKLQELQSAYNLFVKVLVGGESMSLTRAINLIGDVGFAKNQWAAQIQDSGFNKSYRGKDVELPVKVVDNKRVKELMKASTKIVGAYKSAIREGNVYAVDFDTLVRKYDLNIREDVFKTEE